MGSGERTALERSLVRVCTALRAAAVVAEYVPNMAVRNDVRVVPAGQPAEREELR